MTPVQPLKPTQLFSCCTPLLVVCMPADDESPHPTPIPNSNSVHGSLFTIRPTLSVINLTEATPAYYLCVLPRATKP
jgi:hypothetical protein